MPKIKQHKPILKVLFNPILRIFGFSIVSKFEGLKFKGYTIKKYPKYCKIDKK